MTDKQILINYCEEMNIPEEFSYLFESTFGFAWYRFGYRLNEFCAVVMIEIDILKDKILKRTRN